jgi:hypothetical protein
MQVFDVDVAVMYGVDVAVVKKILQDLNYTMNKEILMKEKTSLDIHKIAPYWSTTKIKSLLKKIEGIKF